MASIPEEVSDGNGGTIRAEELDAHKLAWLNSWKLDQALEMLRDHEPRIRNLEGFRWQVYGIAGFVVFAAGTALAIVQIIY